MTNQHLTAGRVKHPYVVGAVIDLGHCFNLLSASALQEVKQAHAALKIINAIADKPMPVNAGAAMGARFLDRAVIQAVHDFRRRRSVPPYDSVRAAFLEGDDLYQHAGFKSRNHIQIAVCNSDRILGYFRPAGL